jgi:phenylacetic acid degradation operon negative regulatory protein
MHPNLAKVLDFFLWGLETFSRRDCGLILAGLRQCESDWQANQWLLRMERRQWIQREGRGVDARFKLTVVGAERLTVQDPQQHWDRPWDGKWRLFTYDLPEKQRSDRVMIWRMLHAHKLGLLQRSVWVWPHSVEPILHRISQASGIPECLCGFLCDRLFLCTDRELVAASWDFGSIHQCHREYLQAAQPCCKSLRAAHDLKEVARLAARERAAYEAAFALDPLLPRRLWPASYAGLVVHHRHTQFRSLLRSRAEALAGI